MFLLAIWLREMGDHSSEKVLLEKAKNALNFIIETQKFS